MNPLDMRGPAFLVFYLLATSAGWLVLYLAVRGAFSAPRPPTPDARRHLRDPYLLAYLRGGWRETLKTLAFALHQRKLLRQTGFNLVATSSKESLAAVTNPLERATLLAFRMPLTVGEASSAGRLKHVIEEYASPLRESGLVRDAEELGRRRPAFLLVAGALLALSAAKIWLALQRGHTNVAFLVILTAVALVVSFAIYRRLRTNAGDTALRDQQTLFGRLRTRVSRLATDGSANEAVLVAATFGLAALPTAGFPIVAQLRRQTENSSSSSGCGSGSSSGCGGGSCGGGCGGCGGG